MRHSNWRLVSTSLAFVAILIWASAVCAQVQTTTFTYQGKLTDGGNPANGNYDLQFALFDNSPGGTQIGSTLTRSGVVVSGGVFSVQLDFGVSAFPGANRFLEIGVRPSVGGTFTALSPRQQISSTPYAIRTLSATAADGLSSACVACVQDSQINSVAGSKVNGTIPVASVPSGSTSYIQNTAGLQNGATFNISGNGIIGGNVGIGTTNPTSKLEIAAQDGLKITGFQPFLTLNDAGSSARGIIASGNGDLALYPNSFIGGNSALIVKNGSGNVGIGTTASPVSRLDIAGQDGLRIRGFQPFLTLTDTSASDARGRIASGGGDLSFYPETSINGGVASMTVKNGGNVGIGTATPTAAKLVVKDTSVGTAIDGTTSTNGSGVFGKSTGASGVGVYGNAPGGGYAIYANGNTGQAINSGGFVKAMLLVNADGSINLCYNSQLTGSAATNVPCGFNVVRFDSGIYDITFPFQVNSRFFSATVADSTNFGLQTGTTVGPTATQTVRVITFNTIRGSYLDLPFYLVVY